MTIKDAEGILHFHRESMMEAIKRGDARRAYSYTLTTIWAAKAVREMGGKV